MSQYLYSAGQVRELDRIAIEEYGIDGYALMCRAGACAYHVLRSHWPRAQRVLVVCGSGNNGGDGYVVARLARAAGLEVRLAAVGAAKTTAARQARDDYCADGGSVESLAELDLFMPQAVVDGLLGTGVERTVDGIYADAVARINRDDNPVLALDIPSGLNADDGRAMGRAVRADVTVTFIGAKLGLYTGTGAACSGEVVLDDLGISGDIHRAVTPLAQRIDPERDPQLRLPVRPRDMHKGGAGRVVVVGGGQGMPGAVAMCAKAAYRGGAGLVRVLTQPEHTTSVVTICPEAMVTEVHGEMNNVDHALTQADVVAIGPGLGQGKWARSLLSRVLETGRPLVIDADGLNLLASEPTHRDNWVLTPHPGEAARLIGTQPGLGRVEMLHQLQQRYGGVVVLKGAGTLVADSESVWLCDRGNPGMASGGMGDVLTGLIAALIAQGMDLSVAARYGVWLHAAAADTAAAENGEIGLMATDLYSKISQLIMS